MFRLRALMPTVFALPTAIGCTPADDAPKFGSAAGDCEVAQVRGPLSLEGFLADAVHMQSCDLPDAGDGLLSFTDYDGNTYAVSGGSTVFETWWQGTEVLEGDTWVMAVFDEHGVQASGVFARSVDGPLDESVLTEFFVATYASAGQYTLRVGLVEGPHDLTQASMGDDVEDLVSSLSPGAWLDIPLSVIEVKSGDVQISVNWDSAADIDLHVIGPDGFRIWYETPWSPSGGEFDLDSNAGCSSGPSVENIYWPTGSAPSGLFTVELALYSACGVDTTNWQVTILTDGVPSASHTGQLTPEQVWSGNPELESAQLTSVTEFEYTNPAE